MSLDERKRKILGAVVRDYVETVRPIGSEDLAARHAWGVKSATIRNEMAELSDLGYLRQPHTSAGRIPSDQGYRYYVDNLVVFRDLETISGGDSNETATSLDLATLLRRTCALLTRMTSYTSVATPPRPDDTVISKIVLSPAGEGRFLLVVLFSNGQIGNRLIQEAADIAATDITSLAHTLSRAFVGKTLDSVGTTENDAVLQSYGLSASLRSFCTTLFDAVRQTIEEATAEDTVFLEGASEIIRQPEFRDAAKLDSVLETLQKRTLLFQTLSHTLVSPGVAVMIGTENHALPMQECSIISASYYVGMRERGTIGVVGPTRMDYDRAMPAVSLFAHSLTQTLRHFTSH